MDDLDWNAVGWEELSARAGRVRLPGWDCTTGLVVGDGAALLVDTGSSLREGAVLRADTRRLIGPHARVTHIALTHPHFDHVLGTAAFAGVEVYGAAGIDTVFTRGRDELRASAMAHGVPREEAAEAADVLVVPPHRVCGEWTLDLGGGLQVLLANVGPAHSGHDLAVLVPGTPEVVFCGDLVEESGEPQAGSDAVPSRWPAALDRLLELGGEDAVYVPGHGAAVNAEFVRAQRAELAARFGVS
ncbi:MBL fold metallo-hydrolase [Streptomyces sp. NPDC056121]|uniref:MBL fold metallo-hydrolase n=1 Tax=Streptomyces TaxID=1883 RepID=UPI001D0A468B|nr:MULTISPECIES: MBL fold metallo-hydrolase [Streptomyces]MCX5081640.1 MBL fold metallo-hydrolase [Streptomyces sp. NBC_00401]UDL99801.1 MBL fold metallo-hydrolase [Streptomyces longhuiensis]